MDDEIGPVANQPLKLVQVIGWLPSSHPPSNGSEMLPVAQVILLKEVPKVNSRR